MSSDLSASLDTASPGRLLRAARLEAGLSEREVEDMLNLMPGYVRILERDDYQSLRSPAFGRGYVRAYGRLLGMDLEQLLRVFDALRVNRDQEEMRIEKRSPPLQRTGLGVGVGIAALLLLVLALWWWHARGGSASVSHSGPQPPEFGAAGAAGPGR